MRPTSGIRHCALWAVVTVLFMLLLTPALSLANGQGDVRQARPAPQPTPEDPATPDGNTTLSVRHLPEKTAPQTNVPDGTGTPPAVLQGGGATLRNLVPPGAGSTLDDMRTSTRFTGAEQRDALAPGTRPLPLPPPGWEYGPAPAVPPGALKPAAEPAPTRLPWYMFLPGLGMASAAAFASLIAELASWRDDRRLLTQLPPPPQPRRRSSVDLAEERDPQHNSNVVPLLPPGTKPSEQELNRLILQAKTGDKAGASTGDVSASAPPPVLQQDVDSTGADPTPSPASPTASDGSDQDSHDAVSAFLQSEIQDTNGDSPAGHPEQPADYYTPLPSIEQVNRVAKEMAVSPADLLKTLTPEEILFLDEYETAIRSAPTLPPPSADPDAYIRFAWLNQKLHYPDDKDYAWFRWAMASAFGWTLTRDQAVRVGEGNLDVFAEIAHLQSTPESEAYNAWKAQRPYANGPDRVYFQKDTEGNIIKVFLLEGKASGRGIGASTFNSGRNRGIDESIAYLMTQNDPSMAMGEQLRALRRSGVPFEGIAVGTAPGGRWRESFTTNVRGASGGVVMDEQGYVQEGSAWGTVLDLIPQGGATDSSEVPTLPTDQD